MLLSLLWQCGPSFVANMGVVPLFVERVPESASVSLAAGKKFVICAFRSEHTGGLMPAALSGELWLRDTVLAVNGVSLAGCKDVRLSRYYIQAVSWQSCVTVGTSTASCVKFVSPASPMLSYWRPAVGSDLMQHRVLTSPLPSLAIRDLK